MPVSLFQILNMRQRASGSGVQVAPAQHRTAPARDQTSLNHCHFLKHDAVAGIADRTVVEICYRLKSISRGLHVRHVNIMYVT